jgi:hypothetical protein
MVTLSMIGEALTGREAARDRRSVADGPAQQSRNPAREVHGRALT